MGRLAGLCAQATRLAAQEETKERNKQVLLL